MIFFSQILLLICPLFFAGLLLVFILKMKWFSIIDIPVDFEKKLFSKRIFGDNKTWRGVFFLLFGTLVCGIILATLFPAGVENFPDFAKKNIPFTFLVLGVSYIIGELLNSFIKRQFSISPGKVIDPPLRKIQRFIDLSDGIISSLFVGFIFFQFPIHILLVAGSLGIFCHYLIEKIMITSGLKSE